MKKWEKPLVISLYRGKPEEHVLCGCKYTTSGTNSGISNGYHCDKSCSPCKVGNQS
jgi:hypothetical protein